MSGMDEELRARVRELKTILWAIVRKAGGEIRVSEMYKDIYLDRDSRLEFEDDKFNRELIIRATHPGDDLCDEET